MATHGLRVLLDVSTQGFNRQLNQAGGGLKKFGMAAGAAGAAVGAGLVVQLKASVDAAIEAQKAQARFEAQMRASGKSMKRHGDEIERVIQKHSRLAGVDDEDLSDAFTSILRATGSVTKAMKDMGLVTDLMRAKNMDAAKAGDLLAKVHNGNVGALKRMGIAIDPVTKAQDALKASSAKATAEQVKAAKASDKNATATKALAELQKRVGGQAKAYGETAAGAQERFAVAVENLQEKVGAKLLPVITTVTNRIATFVGQMESGAGAGGRFAEIVSTGIGRIKSAAEAAVGGVRAFVQAFKDGEYWAGALATALFGVSGALVFAYQKSDQFKNAVNAAFAAVRDRVASTVEWIKANTPAAFDAARNAAVTAFEAIKTAIGAAVGFISGWLTKHRDDVNAFGNAWKNIATGVAAAAAAIGVAVKWAFENVIVPVVKRAMDIVWSVIKTVWPSIKRMIEGVLQAIGGLINVFSGVFTGDFKRAWEGVKDIFGGGIKAVLGLLKGMTEGAAKLALGIGSAIKDGIVAAMKGLGNLIKDAIVSSVKWAASNVPKLIGESLKALGGAITAGIKAGFSKLNPFGDGFGNPFGDGPGLGSMLPSGLGGSRSLQGADARLGPIAGAASRFGLGVTSGRAGRENKLTATGNVSYHSTGEAIDVAGSPAGMLGFFKYMKATAGSRLAELIYTPGGAGINNGRSYTYTGKTAADHFDHVHVAMDLGHPGVGIGDGPGYSAMTSGWNNGPKRPMSHNQVAALAESVGLPGETFAQIAKGESGYDPDNIGHDPGGTQGLGLWQITTKFNDDIIRKYGGPKAMLDARTNALAARDIWRRQGKSAWYGTRYVKGWNLHYKGSLAEVNKKAGSKGAAASPSGGSSTSTSESLPENPMFTPVDPNSAEYKAAAAFGQTQATGGRPLKGGGPTKGFASQAEADATAANIAARQQRVSPLAPLQERLEQIDLQERAGVIDSATAAATRTHLRQQALNGYWGSLSQNETWQIMGDLRDALNSNTAAMEEANRLKDQELALVKEQNANYKRSLATSQSQYGILAQAIADVANGQIGQRLGLGLSGLRSAPGSVARV